VAEYLAEVTRASQRNPVRDILSTEAKKPPMVMWLDDLPAEVVPSNRDPRHQHLVSVAPSRTRPAPPAPAGLVGWLDAAGPWQLDSLSLGSRR
jgi:hypothetical protein